MRRAWLHVLLLLVLAGAGAAKAQPPPDADASALRGPYVGDETHRGAPLDDIPFPEVVTPRERPLVFARPAARSSRAHASRGRHAAASRHHGKAKAKRSPRRRRR